MPQYKVKYEIEVELPARNRKEAGRRADNIAESLETVTPPNKSSELTWWPETAAIMSVQIELW